MLNKNRKRSRTAILVLIVSFSIGLCMIVAHHYPSYWFLFYDHIQYNGYDYDEAEDQNGPDVDQTEERIPVYIAYTSSWLDTSHVYYASGYIGDEEHIYLFFDGAVFKRCDTADGSQY